MSTQLVQRSHDDVIERTSEGRRSRKAYIAGWVLTVVPSLFLLMGVVMNLTQAPQAVEGMQRFGYPQATMEPIGIVLLISVILYLIPQTAVLGAILLTGYFGGAVATHVRVLDPLRVILYPVGFAAVIWMGLYLRDPRLRALIPLRRRDTSG